MSGNKILLATTGTYPDGMASTYRIHCYAKSLIKESDHLRVISVKSQEKKIGKAFFLNGESEGVPFTIIWNKGKFKYVLYNYAWAQLESFVLLFYLIFNSRKFDILWLYGMALIPRLLLIIFIKIINKKIVLELNEYPYETGGDMLTRVPLVNKILKKITWKLVIPNVDGVVSISENLSKEVIKVNSKIPIIKIPILVDSKDVSVSPKRMENERYIFHAGSLSLQKDGIVKVFEAFCIAAKKLELQGVNLRFILTNKMTQKEVWSQITGLLEDSGMLEKLKITGYLNHNDLFSYLKGSDVLIINKPNNMQNKYNFPTKLGDYLLSKVPVIIGSEGVELNQYIHNEVNGIVVSPDDSIGIAEAIVRLCTDRVEAEKLGQKGFETAMEHFNYLNYGKHLSNFFDSLRNIKCN